MKKCLIASTVSRQFTLFEKGNIEVLKELGYEIHCVANYSDVTEEMKELGVMEHHIDIQRSPFSLKNIRAYKQLKKIINTQKFDLIHCHSPMGGVLTRLASRKTRKINKTRVLYTAHGFHFFKGAPLINWLLYYPIEKYLSKYTDCIITINQEDYNIAKNKFKSKRVELVNGIGVDKDKFDFEISEQEKEKLRNDIEIDKNSFICVCVGELNKNKNQMMAIKAVQNIKHKNINLLIIGKGNLKEEYERYIKNNNIEGKVKLLGYRNDINKLLKISDVLLSCSKREGLPVNVMEAIVSNIPVIATNCRGNRDLVINDINGYLVKKNDIMQMTKCIEYMINDKFQVKQTNITQYELNEIKKVMKKIYTQVSSITVLQLLTTRKYSGAENVAIQIIKMFEKDTNIKMAYCSPQGEIAEKLKENKIDFLPLKSFNYRNINKIVKQFSPDIIHAHDIKATVMAVLFSRKCKIISHLHGNHDNMKKINMKTILYYLCRKKIAHILYVSKSIKRDFAIKQVFSNAIFLRNNININEIENKIILDKKKYSYDIIFIGRLNDIKNPLRLVELIKNLKNRNTNITLAIVGEGELRKEVEEKINKSNLQNNVFLLGYMNNPYKILKESKVMAMVSKYEGTPMCALEAMALGIPIVATPTDGLKELVENDYNGFLSDDDKMLEKYLYEIIEDDNKREKMTQNTIKKFNIINNIKKYKTKLIKIYNGEVL